MLVMPDHCVTVSISTPYMYQDKYFIHPMNHGRDLQMKNKIFTVILSFPDLALHPFCCLIWTEGITVVEFL